MREAVSTDRWVTSPRSCPPPGGGGGGGNVSAPSTSRPKSVCRELYRPAVQDLSEQAARNGAPYPEETILSVVSTCTPRYSSRPGSEMPPDKYPSPGPALNNYNYNNNTYTEEPVKPSPATNLCFTNHNTDYLEDLHRQRVLVSAHQRRKLHSQRRSRSTPLATTHYSGSASDVRAQTAAHAQGHRNSWQATEEDMKPLELIVTNGKLDETVFKERINYRLTMRTKPKSAYGSLKAGGTPLPLLNGYNQTLLQSHPKYSQQYTKWLTNGLKVQSFQFREPLKEFSHAKPPPPLLQYINRPKTVAGSGSRWATSRVKAPADFNVVGVQKEVQCVEGHSTQTLYNSGSDKGDTDKHTLE